MAKTTGGKKPTLDLKDEIEYAFNSSFLYKCEYQNENRALSTSTSTMEELDPGEHRITATAVYYGIKMI